MVKIGPCRFFATRGLGAPGRLSSVFPWKCQAFAQMAPKEIWERWWFIVCLGHPNALLFDFLKKKIIKSSRKPKITANPIHLPLVWSYVRSSIRHPIPLSLNVPLKINLLLLEQIPAPPPPFLSTKLTNPPFQDGKPYLPTTISLVDTHINNVNRRSPISINYYKRQLIYHFRNWALLCLKGVEKT